jgi:hypothetical protein
MASLINDAHAAVSDSFLQLIATVKNRLTGNGVSCGITIVGAMVDLIGEAAPANWAFFHLSARVLWQFFILQARGAERLALTDRTAS